MKIDSLEALHASMASLSIPPDDVVDMQHFRLTSGAVEFDCLFSVRGRPYSLSLTSRGASPEFFLFAVSANYEVANNFDPAVFKRLAQTLRTTGASGNKLIPKDFWAQINTLIPRAATRARLPDEKAVIQLRPDISEERDKPYFSHWKNPGKKKDGSPAEVSERNQQKTLELLGEDALTHSTHNHVSSSWSPVPVRKGWRPTP